MSPLLCQPAGAFLGQEHPQPKNSPGDDLQANRDLPLACRVWHVRVNGVVDPVRGHDAQGEEELEEGSQRAANILGCHLGRVGGDDDGGHTHSNAADDAGDVEGGQGVRVDSLDDGADVEDERG